MSPALPGILFQEILTSAVMVAGPLFGVLLVVGFLVGVLQAATQINDAALGFLPKVLAAVGLAWWMGSWMADRWSQVLAEMIRRMAGV